MEDGLIELILSEQGFYLIMGKEVFIVFSI